MSDSAPHKKKVIFVSNVYGKFDKCVELLNRITTKNGPFDLIVLNGNVFSQMSPFADLSLLNSINTEIIIFDHSDIGGVLKAKIGNAVYHFSDTVTILGKSGVYSSPTTHIKFAFLNGKEDLHFLTTNQTSDFLYSGTAFTKNDIDKLLNEAKNTDVDFLLCNVIPANIFNEIKNDFSSPYYNEGIIIDKKEKFVSTLANVVCDFIDPRYIISSTDDFYYERKPYLNKKGFLTRFVHLAWYMNKTNEKEKFIYALSITPLSIEKLSTEEESKVLHTLSPFELKISLEEAIKKLSSSNATISSSDLHLSNLDYSLVYEDIHDFFSKFGKILQLKLHHNNKGKFTGHADITFADVKVSTELLSKSNYYTLRNRKIVIASPKPLATPAQISSKCWFCFTNPQIDKTLLIKSFNNFYIAYPKGPITPLHILLLPKKHISSYNSIDTPLKQEFSSVFKSICDFITDVNDMDYFVYEKNLPYDNLSARHLVINIVGVDRNAMCNYVDLGSKFFEKNKLQYTSAYTDEIEYPCMSGFYYFINGSTGIKIGNKVKRVSYVVEVKEDAGDFTDYPRDLICQLIGDGIRNWRKGEVDYGFLEKLKEKINKFYI